MKLTRTGASPYALPLAWLLATLTFAVGSTAEIPARVFANRPALALPALAAAVLYTLVLGAPSLLSHMMSVFHLTAAPTVPFGRRAAAQLVPSAALGAAILGILSQNPGFLTQRAPLVLVGAVVPLLALVQGTLGLAPVAGPLRGRRFPATFAAFAGIGALAVHLVNRTAYPGNYPPYHLGLTVLSLGLLHVSCAHLATLVPGRELALRGRGILLGCVALPFVALSFATGSGEARAFFAHHSLLGAAPTVVTSYDPSREVAPRTPEPRAADAVATFRARTAWPPLEDEFRLGDFNVLLVVSEATRYDQTSLASGARGVTPRLAAEARRTDSFTFHRAYAPSSGTLFSMASLFTMRPPSATDVRAFSRRWNGELATGTRTVAEAMHDEGRRTFWIGHNLTCIFGNRILGLDQGFDDVHLVPCDETVDDRDAWIVDRVSQQFDELARTPDARFFGWVFLSAAHEPYRAVTARAPIPKLDRYRRELNHVDAQLARLLDALERSGLARTTLVIVLGDHGEEFGEHGGSHHANEVYEETTHVPLLVRIPGARGRQERRPVSLTHLFPWLLLHGSGATRELARGQMEDVLVPFLEATDGAVVSELLGKDRMRAAIRTVERTVIYDFIAGLPRVYDARRDPGEHDDLYGRADPTVGPDLARLRAYLDVRARHRRFGLRPDYFIPTATP